MREIFVNLKRFDVLKQYGGLCPSESPIKWIDSVIRDTIEAGLGRHPAINLTFMLPEGLIPSAAAAKASFGAKDTQHLSLGIQGVFREDVAEGANFGAFTTNTPAAAAKSLGCEWAIIGHSEERKDKRGILERYDPDILSNAEKSRLAGNTVSALINDEVCCAVHRGLHVLLCIGESAEERGEGALDQQVLSAKAALKSQIEIGLKGISSYLPANTKIVIGYEPLWAIGPGKTPPGPEYIASIASFIKSTTRALHGFEPLVVYGGGLKEENAEAIGAIESLDGGLIALTRFIAPIAFEVAGLKRIIMQYIGNAGESVQ